MNNYGKKCKIFTHSNDSMKFIEGQADKRNDFEGNYKRGYVWNILL